MYPIYDMTSSQLLALLKAWRCHRGCISMAMWQFWQNFLVLGFRFRAREIEKKKAKMYCPSQINLAFMCFVSCFVLGCICTRSGAVQHVWHLLTYLATLVMQVYKAEDVSGEVIIEMDVTWAGEQNVQLIIKPFPKFHLGVGLGVGRMISNFLTMRVGVGNLFFSGRVRLSLKPLMGRIPVVGAVRVSFVEQPHFNYALTVYGGDISFLPGNASYTCRDSVCSCAFLLSHPTCCVLLSIICVLACVHCHLTALQYASPNNWALTMTKLNCSTPTATMLTRCIALWRNSCVCLKLSHQWKYV